MGYNDYLRMKILSEMSEEDRHAYLQHKEVMEGIHSLDEKVSASKHSFMQDFGANVAGNALWDGAVWIVRRLLRRL